MAQRLKNIVRFTGLTPNVPAQLPHGLQDSEDQPLTPDILAPSIEGATVTADATNVFVTVNATAIDVYCEAWHTLERSFGNSAITSLVPQPFVIGGGAGGGGQFIPDRTLFVAKDWPAGSDPTVFFTTITAAEAQAATMAPNSASPVNILVFAGNYVENVTLVSNVNLIGMAGIFNGPRIDGNVTWMPGIGVNAPQAVGTEQINLVFINFPNDTNIFTLDSTGKGLNSGTVTLVSTECQYANITASGRAGASSSDNTYFFNCNWNNGTYTFTNINGVTPGIELVGTRFRGLNLAGDTRCRIQGGANVLPSGGAPITLVGTSILLLQGLNIDNPVTVASGCSLTASGCILNNTLTVAAGGTADVRGTNYRAQANLIGPGTINRTTWNGTTAATGVIAYTVPYPTGETSYNVLLQLVAGPGNAAATVTAKTETGFTLTDGVGGNTWDYTVVQE